jgi:hypothetical protein
MTDIPPERSRTNPCRSARAQKTRRFEKDRRVVIRESLPNLPHRIGGYFLGSLAGASIDFFDFALDVSPFNSSSFFC